jgi:hypothetical protein
MVNQNERQIRAPRLANTVQQHVAALDPKLVGMSLDRSWAVEYSDLSTQKDQGMKSAVTDPSNL